MNLASWAERNGVARVAAYRWFHPRFDDDLVWDMTEILTSMCARLYGGQAAQNRAKRAAAASEVAEAAS